MQPAAHKVYDCRTLRQPNQVSFGIVHARRCTDTNKDPASSNDGFRNPLVLGLDARMQDPHVYVVLGAPIVDSTRKLASDSGVPSVLVFQSLVSGCPLAYAPLGTRLIASEAATKAACGGQSLFGGFWLSVSSQWRHVCLSQDMLEPSELVFGRRGLAKASARMILQSLAHEA